MNLENAIQLDVTDSVAFLTDRNTKEDVLSDARELAMTQCCQVVVFSYELKPRVLALVNPSGLVEYTRKRF